MDLGERLLHSYLFIYIYIYYNITIIYILTYSYRINDVNYFTVC